MYFGRLGKFVGFLSPWEFVFVSLFFGIYRHIARTNRANKSSFEFFRSLLCGYLEIVEQLIQGAAGGRNVIRGLRSF